MEIEIIENVFKYNEAQASTNREIFKENNIVVFNLLSSPGAGKTSLILETLKRLKNRLNIGVVEGDISSTHDAMKIKEYIDEVVQINTGGTCHLNATMVAKAIEKLDLKDLDVLIIENVGNLICPVSFDLGEDFKVLVSSVSEGHDKPVKYPPIFVRSNLILLNKIDLLNGSDFDTSLFEGKVTELNPGVQIIKLSCKTGVGIDEWIKWLEARVSGKILNVREFSKNSK
ncbi:MAG: hydrogenase nickel incorporation protein HypB [Actinobacteria bacterium]|nr:hydrogenase nickel incorporation protein HypB [Actinomycetota bacterium]